jgi:predicted membrane protein
VPFAMLLLPGLTVRRTVIATILVMMGVFMMRWNVVIGGQSFSLSFAGYMDYTLPVIPHNWETFREGVGGALVIAVLPFIFFYFFNKFCPTLQFPKKDMPK